MTISTRQTLSLALALALPYSMAHAAGPASHKSPLTVGVSTPATLTSTDAGHLRADGSAATLYQPVTARHNKDADARALATRFLAEHAERMGLSEQELGQLQWHWTKHLDQLSVLHFRQMDGDAAVYGSDIAITIGNDGRVLFVDNSAIRGLGQAAAATLDAEEASRLAHRHLGQDDPDQSAPEPMIHLDAQGKTHRAWRVISRGWEVLVDGNDGSILRAEDKKAYFDGTGHAFDPDPLSASHSKYGQMGYSDNNNRDSTQLTAALKQVLLRDLTLSSQGYALTGPFAACIDLDAPHDDSCPSSSNGSFLYTRSHAYFDAVNAYHHIDKYMRYVTQTLRVDATPARYYAGGVQFDPHGSNGDDNSYYSSATAQLSFGQGGVDDAQDADVVIHELGHGIHHWLTGGVSQVQGLSEGVGDYLAAGYSRDLQQWPVGAPEYHWVFNWDGHNPFWDGRVTNWHIGHSYPDHLGGPLHTAGQYFASCNLLARDAIGGAAMDKAFLTGLAMTGRQSNQKDVAQAILIAARTLEYSDEQVKAIMKAYNEDCTYGVTLAQ
ncbi:hypothetical protein [Dyella sp.]|uniref:hypothetical protein n=1 Tax=Dyella sp. TaxID=1869338 RepID=UPI002ED48D87